jgi:hypothetical protein
MTQRTRVELSCILVHPPSEARISLADPFDCVME